MMKQVQVLVCVAVAIGGMTPQAAIGQESSVAPWNVASWNFDGGLQGWTVAGNGNSVQWAADGTPASMPGGAYQSGSRSLNYNNGSTYDSGGTNSGTATSPAVDITGTINPRLVFQCNYETESYIWGSYDQRRVQVQAQGGGTLFVDQLIGDSMGGSCPAMGTWHTHTIALDPAWGSTRIRLLFDTRDGVANNYPGWFVDDVAITVDHLLAHVVTAPDAPIGPKLIETATSVTHGAGGAACSWGHELTYQFAWPDDNTVSGWVPVPATASHDWTATGDFDVKAQAKCSADLISELSTALSVTVAERGVHLADSGNLNSTTQQTVVEVFWNGQQFYPIKMMGPGTTLRATVLSAAGMEWDIVLYSPSGVFAAGSFSNGPIDSIIHTVPPNGEQGVWMLFVYLYDGLFGKDPSLTLSLNEAWVVDSDSAGGVGTDLDPYRVNSALEFDLTMRTKIKEHHTIHLGPGEFQTHGSWLSDDFVRDDWPSVGFRVRDGWKVQGASMDFTTLKLVFPAGDLAGIDTTTSDDDEGLANRFDSTRKNTVLSTGAGHWNWVGGGEGWRSDYYSKITISELTIDCNYNGLSSTDLTLGENLGLQAVNIRGTDNTIRNVRVVGAAGLQRVDNDVSKPLREQFIISLQNERVDVDGEFDVGVIEKCRVEQFPSNAGYCSAISILGSVAKNLPWEWTKPPNVVGVIRECEVTFPPGSESGYAYNATGSAASFTWPYGVEISNSKSYHANRGFNNDTGPNTGLRLYDNEFRDCGGSGGNGHGVYLINSNGTRIEGNTITLTPRQGLGNGNVGIMVLPAHGKFHGGLSSSIIGNTISDVAVSPLPNGYIDSNQGIYAGLPVASVDAQSNVYISYAWVHADISNNVICSTLWNTVDPGYHGDIWNDQFTDTPARNRDLEGYAPKGRYTDAEHNAYTSDMLRAEVVPWAEYAKRIKITGSTPGAENQVSRGSDITLDWAESKRLVPGEIHVYVNYAGLAFPVHVAGGFVHQADLTGTSDVRVEADWPEAIELIVANVPTSGGAWEYDRLQFTLK